MSIWGNLADIAADGGLFASGDITSPGSANLAVFADAVSALLD